MNIDTSGNIGGLITAFLIFIDVGGVTRASLLILGMISDDTSLAENKKKLKNLIVFMIIANVITGIAQTVLKYFN